MDTPLISVIVPCYNQAQYLDECLQSVLEQTYQNWECIIVNDGSPDNTEDVAKKWTEKDRRFKYLKKENGGLSSARNAGIEAAQGEWILPLDADDKIGSRYLELAEKEFGNGYSIIYCEAEFFGEKSGKWHLPDFSLTNLAKDNIIFCSAFFKKKDWEQIGGYDVKLKIGLEDWDFNISLLKHGGNTLKLNYTGFFYRIKNSSMIKDLNNSKKIPVLKYIEKKHIDFFHEQLGAIHMMVYEIETLKLKEKELIKIMTSKRYIILNKILRFFKI